MPTGVYDRSKARRGRPPKTNGVEDWVRKAILWSPTEEKDFSSNYQQSSAAPNYSWRCWYGPAIVMAYTDRSMIVRDAFNSEGSEHIVVRDKHDFLTIDL